MTGLRERKKARTRQEIVEAALELFEKKGFDETTIDDVAAAAEVSPRTIFRYFATKEDLVFLGQEEENRQIALLLKEVAKSADPIEELMRATRTVLLAPSATPEQFVRCQRLIERTPSLRAYQGRLFRKIEELVSSALLPARGSKHDVLHARLLAAVYLAALNVVMSSWIESGAKGVPTAELDMAEALLRRAFPRTASQAPEGRRRS
ncbi:TetR/AcrR family transcriptional regulator [Hyalangium versicolor]|uniref:TetR/AcrR family transcriptional regulator n=1 Tax=Hyalangium versicolor TaxID=2861190 RepID=UPI001CD022CD|nr:TetR family transcriptional regulator [Hyalangium versicolor]